MKITKEQLKQIIKEELTEVQGEFVDEYVERIRNALEGHQKRPEVMKWSPRWPMLLRRNRTMKITKLQLKQIIQEELGKIAEVDMDDEESFRSYTDDEAEERAEYKLRSQDGP